MLSPLKFTPIYKERVWGGNSLSHILDRLIPQNQVIGESWEISGLIGDESVVSEGPFEGNEINELVEVYMEQLVGDKVYQKFGNEFPILVKFLDTSQKLSIQVHPNDELAAKFHHSYGKSEMWYIVDCKPEAEVYIGFNKKVSKEEYSKRVADGSIQQILNKFKINKGDTYFVPSGVVHALGDGVLALEIQQTSDITYRIYDWGRQGDRELHLDLAQVAINLDYTTSDFVLTRKSQLNQSVTLLECEHFIANIVELNGQIEIDCSEIDSFIVLTVVEGEITTDTLGKMDAVMLGETILIPAQANKVVVSGKGKFLESYIV